MGDNLFYLELVKMAEAVEQSANRRKGPPSQPKPQPKPGQKPDPYKDGFDWSANDPLQRF